MTTLANGRTNGHTPEAAPPARSPKGTRSKVERHPVPLAVTLEAIARYEAALRHHMAMEERAGSDPAFDLWTCLATDAYTAACGHLVNTILAWDPGSNALNARTAHERYHLPRGVISGGKLYLAVLDDDEREELLQEPERYLGAEGVAVGRDRVVMRLAVIEMSNVEDLDAGRG